MDMEVLGLQGYVDKRSLMSIHDGFFDGVNSTINALPNNDMDMFVGKTTATFSSN
jgi:hypothetical protein